MIRDERNWSIGISKLSAFMQHVRPPYEQGEVDEYHNIVNTLAQASGEDLSQFAIPADKMKPRVVSAQRMSFSGRPGYVRYAEQKHCDAGYFQSQLQGLANFTGFLEKSSGTQKIDYESLSDARLQELMLGRRMKPRRVVRHGREEYVYDRSYAVAALLQYDNPKPTATVSNVYNIHDSNFVNSSPGASVTQALGLDPERFQQALRAMKELAAEPALSPIDREQLNIDIETIELQT